MSSKWVHTKQYLEAKTSYVKGQVKEVSTVVSLLARGKGTLSDYLLIFVPGLVGYLLGTFLS